MRPALLVVVMDFLVSSLLLFVSGPGTNWGAQRTAGIFEKLPPAPEFSPAAVTEMERQWQIEYQAQFRDMQLKAQHAQLSHVTEQTRDLTALKSNLESRLTKSEAELEQERRRLVKIEAERQRLSAEQQRRQEQLAEADRRLLELRRAQDAVLADKRSLEQQHAATEAEREVALATAAELQRLKDDLERQAGALRERLRAQAEIIGDQHRTIASQQQAIDMALRDVSRTQTRLESKTDNLSSRQDALQAMLGDLQKLTADLPAELREPARVLAEEQQQLSLIVGELAAAVTDAAERDAGAAESRLVVERLDELTELQKDLQAGLQELLERGMTPDLRDELQVVQRRQDDLRDGISGLAVSLDEMETRQAGPFERLGTATLPVESLLTVAYGDYEAPSARVETFRNTVYAPLIAVGDQYRLVLHGRDLGMEWLAASTSSQMVEWNVVARDGEVLWNSFAGTASLLENSPELVSLEVTPSAVADVDEGKGIGALAIVGREKLSRRGTRDMFLVKRYADGATFAVTAAPDQSAPQYLKVRRTLRPWINFLARHLWLDPKSQPEPGDFLVTSEGQMVGVMIDDQRCLVLDAEDFTQTRLALPLNDPEAMRRMIVPLRRYFR